METHGRRLGGSMRSCRGPATLAVLLVFLLLPALATLVANAANAVGGTPAASTSNGSILWVAGAPLVSSHPVRIEGGYLLVPAVDTLAPLGVEVLDRASQLELRLGQRRLVLAAGKLEAELDGKPVNLPVAPVVESGVWFVPLARVSVALGLQLTWDDQTGRLLLEASPGDASASQAAGAATVSGREAEKSPAEPYPAAAERLQVSLLQEAGQVGLRLSAPVPFQVRVQPRVVSPATKGTVGTTGKPGNADVETVDVMVEGLGTTTKVAIPAILPGKWPSPLVNVVALSQSPVASREGPQLRVELDGRFQLVGGSSVAQPATATAGGRMYQVDLLAKQVVEQPEPGPPRLVRLEWQREADGPGRLILNGSAPRYSYRYQVLKNPSRLAIDLPGTVWTGRDTVLELTDPDFTRLTVTQFLSDQVRIMLDLRHPGFPSVRQDESTGDLLVDILRVLEEVNLAVAKPSEQVQVSLQSSGPVQARAYVLPNPERLIVDLAGAALVGDGAKIDEEPNSLVAKVRVAQFNPRTVRVVLELARPLEVKVNQSEDGSRLELSLTPLLLSGTQPSGLTAGGGQPATTVAWLRRWQMPEALTVAAGQAVAVGLPTSQVSGQLPQPGQGAATATSPPVSLTMSSAGGASGTSLFTGWSETLAQLLNPVSAAGAGAGTVPAEIQALAGRTIVIDPGHGGGDPGTIGVNGVLEKDLALAISLRLAAALRQLGVRVILTRETDTKPEWEERTAPANLNRADALISIHLNSSPGRIPEPRGVEVYYHSQKPGADRLAQSLIRGLTTVLKVPARRLEAWDDLRVLKGSIVPGVLVEVGYLTNPEEAEKLVTGEYQELIVQGFVAGLSQYFATRQGTAGQ
ncbi:MAG: N-acetylmuramoyl-L-alanine amidase [Bacteroidota bacterium]